MGLMFLTAYKIGASRKGVYLTTPRVIQVNSDGIIRTKAIPSTAAAGGHYKPGTTKIEVDNGNGGTQVYGVYETLAQIEVAKNPAATNIYAQDKELSIDAAGADQANATALTKYLNEVDTATATSADGVKLPTAVADKVVVIINSTVETLDVWPNTDDTVAGGAADAATTQAGNSRKHYVAKNAVDWVLAAE